MDIRKAILKDVNALHTLLTGVQQMHAEGRPDIFIGGTTKYTHEQISNIVNNPLTPVYVAVDDKDNVIGYAFCSINEEKETNNLRPIKNFYIDDLCVQSEYRGKGICKTLYNYVLGVAKEKGCYHLTLNVWHLNKNAVKFYEKLGMSPLKTTMEQIIK